MSSFRPNLETKGRLVRAIGAAGLAAGAVCTWPHARWAALLLGVSAAFAAFEAARGWCALRACGVRTKF